MVIPFDMVECLKKSKRNVYQTYIEEVNTLKLQLAPRVKKRRSQEELIKNLPVEVIEYTLEEEERLCPKGHDPMSVIGKEVTREITVIPAKTYVIEHVQYKYACEPCQVHGIDTPVKAAPKPKRAIPESIFLLFDCPYHRSEVHDRDASIVRNNSFKDKGYGFLDRT